MLYEVIKPFGNFKVGRILDSEKKEQKKIITRKLQEGDTVKEIKNKVKDVKMDTKFYENKGAK